MKVLIVTQTCELAIEVAQQEKILEMKQKIQNFLGFPVASQILTVLGWELMDGLDLEDYPIVTEGTKIDLIIKTLCMAPPTVLQNHRHKIQITVKFPARKINIEIEATETVRSLKEKVHIIDGTPIKRMILSFGGREMNEEFRNLSEYGICEFSEVVVFLKTMSRLVAEPPSRMLRVVVQTSSSLLNAARIPVEMKDSSTVNDMKQSLVIRKVLPADEYIFIHKQRIMRENCSLRWHGVENGESLYVFKGTVSRGGF
ncbi:polyubiquitin [Apium graveolens]|uniref:polyubiquitin n=1 Tax=Apium graveolens TaxID=4045 RepID=UPI003D79B807